MNSQDFLPPILTQLIKKKKNVSKYRSYQEAYASCPANAYQNEELCNVIADKTVIYATALQGRPSTLNPTTVYLAFALNYFATALNKQHLTVLDFGGACGAHYLEVKNLMPKRLSIKWIVVETDQMVRSARSRQLEKDGLHFSTNLEEIAETIDFVHSSSTLQYVPDPYGFLQKLIAFQANMMLFNRMMFNQGDQEIITVQRSLLSANGPGQLPKGFTDKPIRYPHTALSFDKFNATLLLKGYVRLSEFEEGSGTISLGNEKIIGKGLLFIRNDCDKLSFSGLTG